MSEQFKQEANSQEQVIDDDPLAELARIVAGEPELNPPSQSSAVDEVPGVDVSMEAALEEQLMQEFSSQEVLGDSVEAPAFVDDINASIEEITNSEPNYAENNVDASVPEPVEEVSVQPTIEEPVVDSEVGFQDGLIDALELEIGGGAKPEPVAVAEPAQEVVSEAAEPVELSQDPMSDVELNVASMQESLEQELSEAIQSPEPVLEQTLAIHSEPVAEQPAVSLEDDLGSAFASEFENIAAQQMETFEEPISEPVSEPIVSELPDQQVESDPNLEMDFEAAFAQELEGVGAPESEGWSETETAEANVAFATAATPQPAMGQPDNIDVNLDEMELDPGHVGSVEEISEVEASAIAANDNGGGKKYAVAALVIALFAGVIAAGYGFLGGDNSTVASGTPEIIKADTSPVKVKPKDPGGIVPENQDNASYVDLSGENTQQVSQETLTSQTEEPLILNTGAPKSDDRLTPSEDEGATPTANGTAVLPKVVQTVVVKPDGTIITKPATPKPVETALNTVTIGDTSNVEVKPVSTQVIKKPEAIDGAKTTGDVSVPVASPLPKPVVKPKPAPVKKVAAAPKPKKVAPPPVRKSEWVVQVSSQRTPEAAQSSFANMRNKYSALRGRAMAIQRANVNGTTYYRVRVQTASKADANQLCSSIAAAGGGCFVTR